ncbi:MAG: class I poly(R)-hydroxyalkanoic acid synthase, partial [Betaproteobacteria bacterium]|nr:class I poly(R)-hydroxyalkanoic acid synthase [Betaproteobacteria bacterium]
MSSFDNAFDVSKLMSAMSATGMPWGQGMQSLPKGFEEAYRHWLDALAKEPAKVASIQQRLVSEQQRLLQVLEQPSKSGALLSEHDKRFSGEAWQTVPAFRYLAESYLTACGLMMEGIDSVDLDPEIRQRMRFFTKQYLDAISPANFFLTNPEALKSALDTQGESLRHGLENLQADISKGHISMTDEAAFKIGENLAVSPGSVVFENEIFQLIQYAPSAAEVRLRPLLIVPPCINKFYILDLRPDNSFIAYAVEQGFTVFVMSWRNVGPAQGKLTWDD